MSSKQSRKSVSLSGVAYKALVERCKRDGTAMSGEVERMVREFVGLPAREGVVKVVAPKKQKVESRKVGGVVPEVNRTIAVSSVRPGVKPAQVFAQKPARAVSTPEPVIREVQLAVPTPVAPKKQAPTFRGASPFANSDAVIIQGVKPGPEPESREEKKPTRREMEAASKIFTF